MNLVMLAVKFMSGGTCSVRLRLLKDEKGKVHCERRRYNVDLERPDFREAQF